MPPPGRMPSAEPSNVPRSTAGVACLMSCQVGINPVIFFCTRSRDCVTSRLRMISEKPNTPMARPTKPMPSDNSMTSRVRRVWPVSMSVPTVESRRPTRTIAIALGTDPFASTTANTRPSTMREKYSAGPKSSATRVSGAPSAATKTVATQPAKKEPRAAMASAGPARPCFAI